MTKTLLIDGGLGRCVSAIPALEKFVLNNSDCNIITYYWTPIFWGNKTLTKNIIDSSTKGIFDKIKDTKIIKPEPYHNSNFLNERISMTEAFDEEINEVPGNLQKPKLKFSSVELATHRNRIDQRKKTIFIQPFSSTAKFINDEFVDNTNRSLTLHSANFIADFLSRNNFQVIIFDTKGAMDKNRYHNVDDLNTRQAMSVMAQCDYLIGIDSCCNHIGYALELPGTTFFGGTSIINYGYPDWFKIICKDDVNSIKYYPFRVAEFDSWLSEVENSDTMNYTENELEKYCEEILQDIKEKT